MINILTTKDKFKSTIQAIHVIIDELAKNKAECREWELVQANTYLIVLQTLSRKLRVKLISLEEKPGNHRFRYSMDEIHAMVLMFFYRDKKYQCKLDSYAHSVLEEASTHIFLKLLS